jgi:hypothetical protein
MALVHILSLALLAGALGLDAEVVCRKTRTRTCGPVHVKKMPDNTAIIKSRATGREVVFDTDSMLNHLENCGFAHGPLEESCTKHVHKFDHDPGCPFGTFSEPLALCYEMPTFYNKVHHGAITALNETLNIDELRCLVHTLY